MSALIDSIRHPCFSQLTIQLFIIHKSNTMLSDYGKYRKYCEMLVYEWVEILDKKEMTQLNN